MRRLADHLERGAGVADLNLIPGFEHGRALDALAVDVGAVAAARVLDGPLTVMEDEPRMVTRNGAIENQDVVARRPANSGDILMQCEYAPAQQARLEDEPAAQRPPVWPQRFIHLGADVREIVAAEGAEAIPWIADCAATEADARGAPITRRRDEGLRAGREGNGGDLGGGLGDAGSARGGPERYLRTAAPASTTRSGT